MLPTAETLLLGLGLLCAGWSVLLVTWLVQPDRAREAARFAHLHAALVALVRAAEDEKRKDQL